MNRPTVSRGGGPPRGGRGGPRGGGRGRGSAVLQRANAQLKGQRVPIPQTEQKDDDDDLGAYLSSLSRKTKEPQWDKFGESDIDISVSSDDQPKPAATPVAASKFLKKKPQETKESATDSKFLKKPGTPASPALTSKSSALNKAAAFVSKFSEKPQKKVVDISDSDLDMDLSMDSDIVADVRAMKQPQPVAKQPIKKPQPKPAPVEKPKRSAAKSPARKAESPSYGDDSISIGLDGSKFTQKKSKSYANFEMSDSSASDAIGKGGSKFLKKKPKAVSPPPTKSPEGRQSPASPQRQPMYRLKSADKYNTQVMLDTDEESLADFIGGLSSSTDPGSARTPRTPKSPSSARQAASKFLKPKLSPVGRPSPEPIIDTIREVDEPLDESVKTESSIEEDSFKIKVFDLDDLEPAVDIQPSKPSKHSSKRSSPSKTRTPRSPREKSRKKETRKDVKKQSKKAAGSDSFFSSMGLQTVEELLAGGGDSPPEEVPSEVEEDVRRSPTPLRSILSPTPRSYTPRRVRLSLSEVMEVRSRSPSPEPISTARGITSRIYTEDFEEEISDSAASIHTSDVSETESIRTLTESGRSSPAARSYSRQSSVTRQRSEEYYSDDFTETSAASRRHTYYSTDGSEASSYSEDYTSYTSRTPSPRSRPVTRSVRVQTSEVPGLWYQWDKEVAGQAGVAPPMGLYSVDPTPIATHVVSADALEALTGYSPSVLALNDMLRQQLQLTQHFVDTQRRMYASYVGASIPDHRYTTLQDTKAYIAKHRKPKLTFDEALRQVKEEMGLE